MPIAQGLEQARPAATPMSVLELEQCDDGFADACGSCNADCSGVGSGATCGDGEQCPELEFCDDGFTDACGSAMRIVLPLARVLPAVMLKFALN